MARKPRIAVILGSTRPTRFVDKPGKWIFDLASQRPDWDVEMVDLRDHDLPFFDEIASNLWMPSKNPAALAWQERIGSFDGFIIVTPEYNRSIPAVLKNALDQAYVEWNHKPLAVVSYGTTGGARAVEHLRTIAIELQMVPVRAAVHILGSEFMRVHPMGANEGMEQIADKLMPSANAMLDGLNGWLGMTMPGQADKAA